jgi:hypothetical protein
MSRLHLWSTRARSLARGTAGASRRPAFPAPSFRRGWRREQSSGQTSREKAMSCLLSKCELKEPGSGLPAPPFGPSALCPRWKSRRNRRTRKEAPARILSLLHRRADRVELVVEERAPRAGGSYSVALLHNRSGVDDEAIVDRNDTARRLHQEPAALERSSRCLILGFQLRAKRVP